MMEILHDRHRGILQARNKRPSELFFFVVDSNT
jgi:hypothetical protein